KKAGPINCYFIVRMEVDRTEISQEELQSWIRDEVFKARLTSPGILNKYSLLQSLLERRQIQATRFLELCQSVIVFENTVKELYSQLGWEYTDLDSDSDDGVESMSCRRTLPFLSVSTGDRIHTPSASRVSVPQSPISGNEENEEIISQKGPVATLKQEAVILLTKLTSSQIAAAKRPALPDSDNAEGEDLSSADSDNHWEPDEDLSESDGSDSDFNSGSKKKRKYNKNGGNLEKLNRASKKRSKSSAKTSKAKTSVSTASTNCDAEMSSLPATSDTDPESSQQDATTLPSNSTKTTKCPSSKTNKTSQISAARDKVKTTKTSQAKTTKMTTQSSTTNTTSQATITPATTPLPNKVSADSNMVKTFTPSANAKVVTPASQQSSETTNAPPRLPTGEIKLDMIVLARKKPLCWQQGKVAEIITKEDGKVKYKITFEEKGKSLVSGHHIAFDRMAKLEELSIGCRVVVKSSGHKAEFQPGIMAELPNRKNHMRFLVYIDDHTPVYVGLPAIHLVYRPLADPLGDILDDNHRDFMREYLRVWPYPPVTQYKVGHILKAEYEGIMQKCEVITVDCSLIEVIFESDQHKEWIYRGSLRLEHMVNMKFYMWKKEVGGKKCDKPSPRVTGLIKSKH
ncbi:hypothetical protein ILYODFUR_027287, partial [Ilyodon furcidens]